jgi:16S rRNA (adenine1518-N6/adenine1519-N6)-dimethyltransferase
MVNSSIFNIMADSVALDANDVVLDIGAGLGFLTRFIAGKCRNVLAVEFDSRLVKVLHEQLCGLSNVEVIEGDVFKAKIPPFNKIVSIPPYQVSSRLLTWLFDKKFDCAVLIFQKEFAERLVASVSSESYSWLTVLTYYHLQVELFDVVSRAVFYPQPEVDSIIVFLKPKQEPPFTLKDAELFKPMLQSFFTQRNRKVRNAILPFLKGTLGFDSKTARKMTDAIPFHDRRVRELAPEDFGVLANALVQ